MELYAIIIAIIVLIITIINWSDIGSFIIGFLDGLNVENDQTKKDLIEDFRIFYNIACIWDYFIIKSILIYWRNKYVKA